ncbi:hypothetical protein Tco_0045502 [Tanacetum coccineum]
MAGLLFNKCKGDRVRVLLGEGYMARQCTQLKRPRNVAWFKEKLMLAKAHESGQVLDEEKLAFLADPGITDCHDVHYGLDVLSDVPQPDTYQNNNMLNQSVQETQYFEQSLIDNVPDNETSDSNIISYEQYLQQTQNTIVQDTNSSAQPDAMILSVFQQMSEQMSNHVTNWDKANQENKVVNESLTAELERYKERVKMFEQRLNVDLSSREKLIDSQMNDMIQNRCALKREINSLKQTLSNQVKEKESLLQTFNVFKEESKEKENKYMDKKIDLEKKIKELDNIKAQRIRPTLYDGIAISKKRDVIFVVDEEVALILEEESQSKMLLKQNDPISIKQKVNITPINYTELNKLAEDFGKRFVPQKELYAEQAFWLPLSNPISKQPVVQTTHVKTEAPKELPKMVKVRTTPNAITEGSWGFGHIKAVFKQEVIPFIKTLRYLFKDFDNGLHNELNEVKTVFNQMEAVVKRCSMDKKYFDIQKKEIFLDNDRLLEHIIYQDVMNIIMHADFVLANVLSTNNECLVHNNLKIERLEQENEHLFELLLSQDIVHIYVNYLATLTNYAKMEQDYSENLVLKAELAQKEHMIEKKIFDEVEFFNINEWQAKLKAKDVSIANLRKHIESFKGKSMIEKDATPNKAKVIAPRMFKLNLEPLSSKVLKNRDAHIDYIKHTQENANILRELVKHARALRPLDSDLDSACKYAKRIQEQTWKPTGKVFTDVGYRWKPTGRTFTIVGTSCPLTMITSTKVEPLKETTLKSVTTTNLEIKIYRRITKVAKSVDLNTKPSCPNYSLVSGLRMLQAYDRKPLLAHQLCSQISRFWSRCQYGVSNGLDTAYWSFLE